jgi:hypothetical protein
MWRGPEPALQLTDVAAAAPELGNLRRKLAVLWDGKLRVRAKDRLRGLARVFQGA